MYAHPELEKDFSARATVLSRETKHSELGRLIDSTLLKPDVSAEKVRELCLEAAKYGFRTVCIPPAFVSLAKRTLVAANGGSVGVCTVIGFPLGYSTTSVKVAEVKDAVSQGADEVDFVQNVSFVKDAKWELLEVEYRTLVEAADGRLVKVILETSLLSEAEIRECTLRAAKSGVHVIKTSTGFGSRGALADDLRIISKALSEVKEQTGLEFGIKASGGIRSLGDAIDFINIGATRLGTSSGVAILQGQAVHTSY